MAWADDFSVAVNGDIRHESGSTNYTVLQTHRALQDLADDAQAVGDDIMAISHLTPSDRSTDNIVTLLNGYNIDDAAAVFLYDGSIAQLGGATVYTGLVVVGAVEVGTNIIIMQDNGLLTDTWTSAPNANAGANILMRKLVKTRDAGVDIDGSRIICMAREYGDTYAEFSVTMVLGNNTAALFTSADGNNTTPQGTVNAYDKLDNTEGYQLLEISGSAPAEPYYSQWQLTGTGSLPVSPVINDLYEQAKDIQRRGTAETIAGINGSLFRGITHEWAYDGITGVEPATNEVYAWGAFLQHGVITGGPFQVGEVVTGGTSGAVGRVLSQDATEESLIVSTESGTWNAAELITGTTSGATATTNAAIVGQATGGGTALVLAADSVTGDEVWIQLTRGTPPANNAICYEDGDHLREITVFGSVTGHTISTPFLGSSTGSALIGAFGIGMDPTDTSSADSFTDLDGASVTPPNNVTFDVLGLEIGEDRVLVGPEAGGILELNQDTINDTGLNTSGITSITMTTAIPLDTPSSGTVRIKTDDGRFLRVPYDSFSGSVYTIPAFNFTSPDNATTGNDAFISYIDKLAASATESFTSVFQSPRALFIRVRDGAGTPIKTFETTGTLGSTGGSATAIRTSDA